jgi:hypothetical protein
MTSLTGYVLPEGLSFDDWAAEGPTLVTMARASMWWLGDWLAWGEHQFGEKYAQAVETTGLAVQTLKNAQWVCDRIPPRDRVAAVPFSHHRAVASLESPRRRALLKAAADEGLTEFEVRKRVREEKAAEAAGADPDREAEQRPRSLTGVLAEALELLDVGIDRHDWAEVGAARKVVAEAAVICKAVLS